MPDLAALSSLLELERLAMELRGASIRDWIGKPAEDRQAARAEVIALLTEAHEQVNA